MTTTPQGPEKAKKNYTVKPLRSSSERELDELKEQYAKLKSELQQARSQSNVRKGLAEGYQDQYERLKDERLRGVAERRMWRGRYQDLASMYTAFAVVATVVAEVIAFVIAAELLVGGNTPQWSNAFGWMALTLVPVIHLPVLTLLRVRKHAEKSMAEIGSHDDR